MKLACYTRKGTSPQGKPRVYLTGHPDDLSVYSRENIDDILKLQDCTVYCDEEPWSSCDAEVLFRELRRMQLVVVLVTSRFLNQPNRARELEFRFAAESRIPILPLMLEQGLEEAFNQKCARLQVLSRYDDVPVMPYLQKMGKFLSAVLVGDELAEKVRAAFDAYVFLSYRKKDRKYAEELMKLIHKNEFCRDIAIWYDEFLVPGENFDQAILDAMEKCDVFTMAVTPNLLEPDNYVMAREYPEAKKAGKIILPVELVGTDREALEKAFPDIGDCIRAGDRELFADALLDTVKKLAIRESDGSPEHKFFIGLAYLNGIDVEVDRERALALITDAAQDGLSADVLAGVGDSAIPEAMEKLASIYRASGNYAGASGWYRRLIVYWNRRFNESGSEEAGLKEAEAWLNYGDCKWMTGPWDIMYPEGAARAYNEVDLICRDMVELYGSVRARQALAVSHIKFGQDLRWDDHNPIGAMQAYGDAIAVLRDLVIEGVFTPGNMGEIADNILNEPMNKPAGWCLGYLETLEKTGTEGDVADCCVILGDCRMIEGRLAEAEEWYRKEMALRKQLNRDTRSCERLCVSYENLGRFCQRTGDLAGAKECFRQALELRRRLCGETGKFAARVDLFALYRILDKFCQTAGDWSGAEDYCREALNLYRQLCGEIEATEERQARLDCYTVLGRVCRKAEDWFGALECGRRALELQRQISEESGAVWALNSLCRAYWHMSLLCRRSGALAEAEEYSLLLAELCERVRRKPDSHPYWYYHQVLQ